MEYVLRQTISGNPLLVVLDHDDDYADPWLVSIIKAVNGKIQTDGFTGRGRTLSLAIAQACHDALQALAGDGAGETP
jgi:hypothetical protein